jgi:mRNA-degrading endonuclease YafQ of YafQ-DinJ toxin-antitoxin module
MENKKYFLGTTKSVDKEIQKLIKNNNQLDKRLRKTFHQLKRDPFYKGLRTHKVNSPKWGFLYSSRVTGDIRLLWYLYEKHLHILVVDIGGHEGSKSIY